jgi:L-ascorbate metabolism protein UlaG (beta-lactamase superfamily)
MELKACMNSYLRQDIVAEPLINRWYATAYLVSPMTAPLMVANGHLPTMRSFASAPMIHVNALKNPEMQGGAYIAHGPERVEEIKSLIAATQQIQAPLLSFAEAVKELDRVLAQEAKGFSLEPLYAKVPAPLKGYVELTYDLQCQPAMRFVEGLLYHSPVYQKQSQAIALSPYPGDQRPFVFSTPRLDSSDSLLVEQPFDSAAWDDLFCARLNPVDADALADKLAIQPADRAQFAALFTRTPPPPRVAYKGDGVRVRYFGHACVLLETATTSILIDPQVSYPNPNGPDRFTFNDLPDKIDYVLFTHDHHDHVVFETLLPLRYRIRNVIVPKSGGAPADPSLKLMFSHLGFPIPRELDEMEVLELADGAITALPFFGEHGDLNIRSKSAWHIRLRGRTFFLGADSNNLEEELYANIVRVVGSIDAMFMGLECDGAPQSWMYGPLAVRRMSRQMDQSRKLCSSNSSKCAGMIARLKPKHVYIYAMGREPWLSYITSLDYSGESKPVLEAGRLVEQCRQQGLAIEDLFCKKEMHFEGIPQ